MKRISLCLIALYTSLASFAISPVTGPTSVCQFDTITLADATPGGIWTTSTPAAIIGPVTGALTGMAAGAITVTYTVGSSYVVYPVSIIALPPVYAVLGDGIFCAGSAGTPVTLDHSDIGISYQLFFNGVATGSPLPGTGSPLDFGPFSSFGYYTIDGTSSSTGCVVEMGGSVIISAVTPIVVPGVSLIGDTICSGGTAILSVLEVNGGPAPVYQWKINGVAVGSGAPTYSYTPATGDVISIIMVSDADCASTNTVGDTATVVIMPGTLPVVSVTAAPGTTIAPGGLVTFTATVTSAGTSPAYQWTINSVPVPSATSATYTTHTLVNGDVVGCTVLGSGPCGHHGSNSVSILVTSLHVSSLFSNIDVRILPNPCNGNFLISGSLGNTLSVNSGLSLQITDMLGRQVYNKADILANNGKIYYPVMLAGKIAPGMYTLCIQSGAERSMTNLVIE